MYKWTEKKTKRTDPIMKILPLALERRHMSRKTLIILILMSLSLLTQACMSPTPGSVTYPNKPQQTMQTVQHWDVLASDIAEIIKDAVAVRPDIANTPMYLEKPAYQPSPFSRTFHELLSSQLVSRGLHVSKDQPTGLVVDYKVMLVKHKNMYTKPPFGTFSILPLGIIVVRDLSVNPILWTALGLGAFLDLSVGAVGITSNHEVIISVSMAFNNQYVVYQTSYYYINDKNWSEYAEGATGRGVTVRAVRE